LFETHPVFDIAEDWIDGSSALVYDDPVNDSLDFCLAKFQGVSADALQTNFDQNAMFQ
jgi:hypothetical protein